MQNFFSLSIKKLTMAEGNRTPSRHFVEIGDGHVSVESGSDAEDNLKSQLPDRKLSSKVDRRIIAMFDPLNTQLEMLIQSVSEISERSSDQSTEGNVTSERSRLSGQLSDSNQGL